VTSPFVAGETVQVLDGAVGSQTYGGDTRTWPVKATYTAAVGPAGSAEMVNARELVTWDLDLYLPPDADVDPVDRCVVRGSTYDVDGMPQRYQNPFTGWSPGVTVRLKEVSG
jgi:hypothetical protein